MVENKEGIWKLFWKEHSRPSKIILLSLFMATVNGFLFKWFSIFPTDSSSIQRTIIVFLMFIGYFQILAYAFPLRKG